MTKSSGQGKDAKFRRKAVSVESFAIGKAKGVTRAIQEYKNRKQKKITAKAALLRQYRKAMKREGLETTGRLKQQQQQTDGDDDKARDNKEEQPTRRRKKKSKTNPYQKSLWKAQQKQQEREEHAARRQQQEKEKETKGRERRKRSKLISQRTKKGQPIMKHMIGGILQKLERSQAAEATARGHARSQQR